MQPTAILFDLDLTLHDRTATLRGYARQLHRDGGFALGFDAFLDRFLSCDGGGFGPSGALFGRLESAFGGWTAAEFESHFRGLAWTRPVLYPEVLPFLDSVGDGIHLGIITNGSTRSQSAKIRNSGLQERMDCVLISESVGLRKPDRAIFERMTEALGVLPGECLFVGDHPELDIGGASAVGMMTAWRHHGRTWPEGHPFRPDYVIASLDDLRAES